MSAAFHAARKIIACTGLCLLLASVTSHPAWAEPPRIIVTIKPLHSLVAGLAAGVTTPVLLSGGKLSLHHLQLRPSDYRKIRHADLLIWSGASLEGYMPALMQRFARHTRFISLLDEAGLHTLPLRHHDHAHDDTGIDPHFWLSTINAEKIVRYLGDLLIRLDATNTLRYQANRERLLQRITTLRERLHRHFDLLRDGNRSFISYHDAFRYFEDEFGLKQLIALATDDEVPPGIRRLRRVGAMLENGATGCFVYNAPNRPAVIDRLGRDHAINVVGLDGAGIDRPPGEALWFELMDTLAGRFYRCLQAHDA